MTFNMYKFQCERKRNRLSEVSQTHKVLYRLVSLILQTQIVNKEQNARYVIGSSEIDVSQMERRSREGKKGVEGK